MAVRIQRLICNVTVHAPPSSSAMAAPASASNDLPAQSPASSTPALPQSPEAGGSAGAENPTLANAEAAPSSAVDPRKLADKVYRLMLEDLRIARERE